MHAAGALFGTVPGKRGFPEPGQRRARAVGRGRCGGKGLLARTNGTPRQCLQRAVTTRGTHTANPCAALVKKPGPWARRQAMPSDHRRWCRALPGLLRALSNGWATSGADGAAKSTDDARPQPELDGFCVFGSSQLPIENYAHVLGILAPLLALCVVGRTQQR